MVDLHVVGSVLLQVVVHDSSSVPSNHVYPVGPLVLGTKSGFVSFF